MRGETSNLLLRKVDWILGAEAYNHMLSFFSSEDLYLKGREHRSQVMLPALACLCALAGLDLLQLEQLTKLTLQNASHFNDTAKWDDYGRFKAVHKLYQGGTPNERT